ncbi:hypothetical protein GUJ93_ZPchr0013g35211 [Zizania palustris]|uniref:Uncharacterized protein n=1 Tax=Zizania palustris TaxID=103762 RepID=A0A8J5X2D3_ZIZPA|nr:hypothetical protein GUJ93_ZPchr0013g35211 [Zizania palustris]
MGHRAQWHARTHARGPTTEPPPPPPPPPPIRREKQGKRRRKGQRVEDGDGGHHPDLESLQDPGSYCTNTVTALYSFQVFSAYCIQLLPVEALYLAGFLLEKTAHLLTKPAHVDLSRKRTWDRLEREQEFGDVISAIRSQNPGAIIVGDYVIETRDAMSPDENTGDESNDEFWSPVRDSVESPDNRFSFSDRRSSRSVWHGVRRPSTQGLVRRGFLNRHYRNSSDYRSYRSPLFDRLNGSNQRAEHMLWLQEKLICIFISKEVSGVFL